MALIALIVSGRCGLADHSVSSLRDRVGAILSMACLMGLSHGPVSWAYLMGLPHGPASINRDRRNEKTPVDVASAWVVRYTLRMKRSRGGGALGQGWLGKGLAGSGRKLFLDDLSDGSVSKALAHCKACSVTLS